MKYYISHKSYHLFILCSILFNIILIHTQSIPFNNSSITKKKERSENALIVLTNIAQMIGQIGRIVEEPHNSDNIGNAVTNIINNILKITINAIQNRNINSSETKEIMDNLQKICKKFDQNINIYKIFKKEIRLQKSINIYSFL